MNPQQRFIYNKIYCILQVKSIRIQVAVVPSAMLSAPLATCVLHVAMAHENGTRLEFHFFYHKWLPQQIFSCICVVYVATRPRSDMGVCTHFPGNNREVSPRISIADSEAVVSCLCLRGVHWQQQSSVRSGRPAARPRTIFQVSDRRKSAKPNVRSSASPWCPRSALLTL